MHIYIYIYIYIERDIHLYPRHDLPVAPQRLGGVLEGDAL